MIEVTDEDRSQWEAFRRTPAYRRIKERVLESVKVHVIGSSRSADQTSLDLAVKEGVHVAFQELEKLALPAGSESKKKPVQAAHIQKKHTPSTE